MYTPKYTKQFKKDLANCKKAGKDMRKIKVLIRGILEGGRLALRFRIHKLQGDYADCWECHIQPDWLFIFKKEGNIIIFERTGSHSKLFK